MDIEDEQHLEPKIGTIFNSENEALECYVTYAKAKGFGAVIKTSKKHEDGLKRNITYGCHRGGKPRSSCLNPLKMHPTTKIDCKAQMNISLQVDGKWRLNSNHNHEMDPEKVKYLKCYRTIPPHAKRTIELNAAAGIKLSKTISSCMMEVGEADNLTWLEKDARNYKDKVRRLQLREGDAEAMHKYFVKMQKDNGDFFYAIDIDEDDRLRNVFWADARSREAYKEFGDVITFDTTYLVNKYDMPFAPFVGVNHHGQSILFGCGLVSREDTTSFIWLSTTQQSESINAFFDGYVHSNTTLKEFVEQYENALRKKVQKEEEEDARCSNLQVQNVSPYRFENQFYQAYTIAKCKQFREQVGEKIGCNLTIGPVVNGISHFDIEQDILVGKNKSTFKTVTFLVHFDEESRETSCNCRLFESKGMVCSHMISVWSKRKLNVVPNKYILRRWRKNLPRSHTKIKVRYANWERRPEWSRYDTLLKLFNEAADVAMYSSTKTNRMATRLKEIVAENNLYDEECVSYFPMMGDRGNELEILQEQSNVVGDPRKGPRIGRPPTKRKQSKTELIIKRTSKKRVQ